MLLRTCRRAMMSASGDTVTQTSSTSGVHFCLDKQCGFKHSRIFATLSECVEPLLCEAVNTRVHDCVELQQCIFIAEDDATKSPTVDFAVFCNNLFAEGVDNCLPSLGLRRVNLVSEQVGIYDGSAQIFKQA